jgi:hypothetical protein
VLAFALQALGDTADDVDTVVAASTAAGELATELVADGTPIRYGPTAGEAVASGAAYNLAAVWSHRSLATAIEWQQRALTLAEVEGDRRITAVHSARLGLLHLLGGDPSAAAAPIARATALMTGPVTARWEDIVSYARASLLEWQDAGAAAEAEYRELTTAAFAGGRLLHACLGSAGLADLLTARGAYEEASAVLRRAEQALADGADDRQRARLAVRRARLLRLRQRSTEAVALLAAVGAGFDSDALSPERIVWFVETALLQAATDLVQATDRIAELDALVARTGVQVPPWERRWWTAPRRVPTG